MQHRLWMAIDRGGLKAPLCAGRTGWGGLGVSLNIGGICIPPGATFTVDMDGDVVTGDYAMTWSAHACLA